MTEPVAPVYLVDDDPVSLGLYTGVLERHGLAGLVTCQDSREVLPRLRQAPASALILDLSMPHLSGAELLPLLRGEFPQVPVIVVTATDDLDTAVACMRSGAFDYLTKPVEPSRLWSAVRNALEMGELQREVRRLGRQVTARELQHPEAFARIVTRAERLQSVFRYVEAVAGSPRPILITGESGTGKELVARAIHELSGRRGAFVAVNAAGLDDTVLSDTLFGHEKGAYTGAEQARKGLVEQAAGGTLFLDEIADLEPGSQTKLLRLLQEGEYYPLGSDRVQLSRARVVAATNADLEDRQSKGLFRKDLFYRLMTHWVALPPLRERSEDLPLLVEHFVREAAASFDKPAPEVPRDLVALLRTYSFPGNIRELQSLVFDALGRQEERTLSLDPFRQYLAARGVQAAPQEASGPEGAGPQEAAGPAGAGSAGPRRVFFGEPFPTLREAEALLIEEALKRSGGNQSLAARMLGVNQSTLSRRLKGPGG
jgi:DNA-binding NtrC family response regulator